MLNRVSFVDPNFVTVDFFLGLDYWVNKQLHSIAPRNHAAARPGCASASGSQDLARFLFLCQLKIQIQQQSQEVPVGVDGPLLD